MRDVWRSSCANGVHWKHCFYFGVVWGVSGNRWKYRFLSIVSLHFNAWVDLSLILIYLYSDPLACDEIHWSYRNKRRGYNMEWSFPWNEGPISIRTSELLYAHLVTRCQCRRVSWSEGPRKLRSPSSPFWECCREHLLCWSVALEIVAVQYCWGSRP